MKITLVPRAIGEQRHEFDSVKEFKEWAYKTYRVRILDIFGYDSSMVMRESVDWWENHILPYAYFYVYKNLKENK